MPLSKARDKERKRQARLDASKNTRVVQPNRLIKGRVGYIEQGGKRLEVELDADGNPIWG